jgi:CxxC-x17-CxxC domain-containing protein
VQEAEDSAAVTVTEKKDLEVSHHLGGKSFGGDRKNDMRAERGGDREVKLFKATCSECNKACDVPFRPTKDKPVYCRDCFAAKRNRETEIYEASKSGKTPSQAKEIFSQVQPPVKSAHTPTDDGMKCHLMDISSKLDTLILAIEKMSASVQENKKDVVADVTSSTQPLLVATKATKKILKAISKTAPKKVVAKPVAKVAAKPAPTRSGSTGRVAPKKVVVKAPAKTAAKVVATKKTVAKKGK